MERKILVFGLVALAGLLVLLEKQGLGTEAERAVSSFAKFRSTFGKSYSSLAEMEYRLGVFRANLDLITRHNADASQTYTLGVNQFADLTFEEFSAFYLSEDPEDKYVDGQEVGLPLVPKTGGDNKWDWRDQRVVGEVKNQEKCGSCWAFSAISVVEEAYAIFKQTPIPNLSEQELVDCSREYGNFGCNGGLSYRGLEYIVNLGINLGKDYPYTARSDKCKENLSGKGAFKIASWRLIPEGPQNMADALKIQPTTASLHVQNDFIFYSSGVYNPQSCEGDRNHAVNAIGFDFTGKTSGIPHFIVRNSWGNTWGEQGFFRIAAREGAGTCWFNGEDRTTVPSL